MHIQENREINKVSAGSAGAKHSYSGSRNHQPKHIQEIPKKKNRGIAVFVVAFVLLAALLLLQEYAVCFIPALLTVMVLSVCAVVRRGTFFSVTALVVSSLTLTIAAVLIVFSVYEAIFGLSLSEFMIFS